MRYIFILTYLPICIFFLFRKIDLFTIIFYTSSLYFLPAFFGFAVSDYRVIDVSYLTNSTYSFYIFYFIILTICSIAVTAITKYFIKNSKTIGFSLLLKPAFDDWIFALRITCPSALWLAWFITPDGLFQGDKNQLLSQLGWIYSFFQYATVFYIVLSFFSKRYYDFLFALALCVFDLLIGFRLVVTFSFFTIIFFYGLFNSKPSCCFKCFVPLLILSMFFIGLTYKSALNLYSSEGILEAVFYFTDINLLYEAIIASESFSRQHMLNNTILQDLNLESNYVLDFLRLLFPGFSNRLFDQYIGFGDRVTAILYPQAEWGMASNVWAEQYSLGGFLWLYLFSLFFFCSAGAANFFIVYLTSKKKICMALIICVLAVPFFFYIHRNDLVYQLVIFRDMLISIMLISIPKRVLTIVRRLRHSSR